MTPARFLIYLVLTIGFVPGSSVVRAQQKLPAFQYRYKNVSLPAAKADEPRSPAFSSDAAQRYLDQGADLWSRQQQCVSCHTHGIYMIVRPALSAHWGKPDDEVREFVVSQSEQIIRDGITTGSTGAQLAYIARGLAEWDAAFSDRTSEATDAALRYLLEIQAENGSIPAAYRWPPLNSDTWHGTIMAAMATATAPGWKASLNGETELTRLEKLNAYLRETAPRHDHQRLLLLWASSHVTELLTEARRREILERIWAQQQDDGGWSIRTFATPDELGGGARAKQLETNPHYLSPASDGYQTGLVVVVLREAGVSAADPRIQKAVQWLLSNQRRSGRWWTRSLNATSRFHFITYSGTAYSALALAHCDALESRTP